MLLGSVNARVPMCAFCCPSRRYSSVLIREFYEHPMSSLQLLARLDCQDWGASQQIRSLPFQQQLAAEASAGFVFWLLLALVVKRYGLWVWVWVVGRSCIKPASFGVSVLPVDACIQKEKASKQHSKQLEAYQRHPTLYILLCYVLFLTTSPRCQMVGFLSDA